MTQDTAAAVFRIIGISSMFAALCWGVYQSKMMIGIEHASVVEQVVRASVIVFSMALMFTAAAKPLSKLVTSNR